ncbi:MAG: Gfo/Idh/MocA family oxidoreductase [Actinobacteria bacterium]|nr:Gfo/Idh/MocA family oxidoreductase [Actinomycetota bacterium]
MRIGVIGCGYWGPNLVRTFSELPDASLVAVADRRQAQLDGMRAKHPQVDYFCSDHSDLFDLDLDAVVVSTPPETHHDLVLECLEHGLDVLVEKPLATTTSDALHMLQVAEERGRIVMVGHIGAYNPAVNGLKQMIAAGDLGKVRYIDAVRVGLGLFHPRLNVVWDLAPHDVSILIHILGEQPVAVTTQGLACVQDAVEDVAYMTLLFPSGVLAHARMSWLDPCKTRRMTVVGERKMVVYDDLESHEKLKIYDKSVDAIRRTDTFGDFQFAYHYGSVFSPYIEFEEPLRVECRHFLECVSERKRPITDAYNGVDVVRVIEAAQQSLKDGGTPIAIAPATAIPPVTVGVPNLRVVSANDERVDALDEVASLRIAENGNGQLLDEVSARGTLPRPAVGEEINEIDIRGLDVNAGRP